MNHMSCIRIFGSKARGDDDSSSDTDVLVIYEGIPLPNDRENTLTLIKSRVGSNVDVAEYSLSRIRHFFLSGDLFAWHLFQESKKLFSRSSDLIDSLGKPQPYTSARKDISGFASLLNTVPRNMKEHPENVTFEAGLLYLATRNIAMSLSWSLEGNTDFSRHAAINLSKKNGAPFPIPESKYNELICCRHASQRGAVIPIFCSGEISDVASKLVTWSEEISSLVANQPQEMLNANTFP
jgi:hypothetical protein